MIQIPTASDDRQQPEEQEAITRARELMCEVGRMREVLRAVGSEEQAGHIPPDAYQYYGRVEKNLEEVERLEEKYGFQTVLISPQAESIIRPVADGFSGIDGQQNNQGPQSAAEVVDAGSLLEFAKTQRFEFQSETTKSVEFGVMLGSEEMLTLTLQRPNYSSPLEGARLDLEGDGEPQFISAPEAIQMLSPQARKDWADNSTEFSIELAQKVAEVVDVAEMFAGVAAAPGATFGVAEKLLADHIDEQLRAGSDHINLTQSYLTEDPKAADARHTLALNNLSPQIEMAQKAGITFEAGEAQLASEKFKEIIAIRNAETPDEGALLNRGLGCDIAFYAV
jgi:hypothetical protein